MNEIVVPEIETERFLLRQIKLDDLDEWARLKYADPEVMLYMPRREGAPRDRAEQSFTFFNNIWAQHDYGAWLVTDKTSGEILGDCYLEPETESGSGEIELGYTIGRSVWGKGVATEAGRAVVRFAFERTEIKRILGVAMPENVGSWRVLEKIGFVFEKKARFYDLDVLVYAIDTGKFQPSDRIFKILDS